MTEQLNRTELNMEKMPSECVYFFRESDNGRLQ